MEFILRFWTKARSSFSVISIVVTACVVQGLSISISCKQTGAEMHNNHLRIYILNKMYLLLVLCEG